MEQTLKEVFLERLEEKYGPRDQVTARFGTSTFGKISSDLSISASQFSKLISGTATEGMYQRSIKNIERLIHRESLNVALEESQSENARLRNLLAGEKSTILQTMKGAILIGIGAFLAGAILVYFIGANRYSSSTLIIDEHPLSTYFDQDFNANFNSPYLDISEVQAFCPCSAFEGTWSLAEQYKLPLPGSRRPGLYYLAKSADVRMKCSRFDTTGVGKGKVLSGYEYLVNEIWVDLDMTPLTPKYFSHDEKQFTTAFEALDFETSPNFRKVASIHSFFIDRFELRDDVIIRKGEPCGRFATDVDEALAKQFEIDIKYILEHVVGNLTIAHCQPMDNIFCNPNDLKEGESVMAFDCNYTIIAENLGIGGGYPYTKGYRLEQQFYSDNLLCNCNQTAIGQ